jgi:hypothetical protein
MSHDTTAAHDPSALVRRGHLPLAEPAKGRKVLKVIQAGPGPLIAKVEPSILSTPYWSSSLS